MGEAAPSNFPGEFPVGLLDFRLHQIEGSPLADGAAPIRISAALRAHTWVWCATVDTGDIACDPLSALRGDVALMGKPQPQAYRFSISWSR